MQVQSAFRLEREMVAIARQWLQQQRLFTKDEFYTPWGVCDLIGILLSEDRVNQRLSLGQRDPIGPPIRIAILNRIPDLDTGRSISTRKLTSKLAALLSEEEVSLELTRLIKAGFVREGRKGRVQKINGWFPLHERIVALELKLERVEEALDQAISHLKFATESYVGFPEEVALRVMKGRKVERFRSSGVGIVAVAQTGCSILLRPESRDVRRDVILQMHCVERFWRSYITGS